MASRPKRLLSAHTNPRPHSAITYSRKELIENVYTAQPQAIVRAASAKTLGQVAAAGIEKSRKIVVKQSRKREEMEQEILRLKQTVNGLTEQLCRQKGKTESMRKKGQKFTEIVNDIYPEEGLWSIAKVESHLVAGVKHVYDQLKTKYELLQQQHELLLKQNNFTREIEHLTYIDALQSENKALKQRLEAVAANEAPMGTDPAQVATYVIAELKTDRLRIAEKYKQLSGRYHMSQETLKDRNRKVQFLEQLIVEKDNNIHAIQRDNKRLRERLQSQGQALRESQGLARSEWLEQSTERK